MLYTEFPYEFPEHQFPELEIPDDDLNPGEHQQTDEISAYQREEEADLEFGMIVQCLRTGEYPDGINREEKSVFQHQVAPFSIIRGVLFRMRADDKLRRCLESKWRWKVIRSLHDGPAGGHLAALTIVERIRAAEYWWATMNRDVKQFIQRCDPCQRSGNPTFWNHWPLTPIVPLAPFEKWGVDFIRPIQSLGSQRHRYIIPATDYATKWVEAWATRKNDANTSARFMSEQIIMRFRHPLELVSNQGTHFLIDVIVDLTKQYNVSHRKTTPYNPKANGLIEQANGIICKILTKVVSAHKTDWDRKLPSAVYAYNSAYKSTTGQSPYFLVFGQDLLQTIELDVETFRIMSARHAVRTEDQDQRLETIDGLEVSRMEALARTRDIQE